jgi:hypothetical protein
VPVIPVPQVAPAILRQRGQNPLVPGGHLRLLSAKLGKGQPGVPNRPAVHSRPWLCEIEPMTSQHKTLDPVRHPASRNLVATNPPVHRPSQIGAVPSQWQLPNLVWALASPMDKTATTRNPTARSFDRPVMTKLQARDAHETGIPRCLRKTALESSDFWISVWPFGCGDRNGLGLSGCVLRSSWDNWNKLIVAHLKHSRKPIFR